MKTIIIFQVGSCMGSFFYNLGVKAGHSVRKGKWVYQSNFGTAEEAVRAEYAIGKDLARQLKLEMPVRQSPEIQKLVDLIGNRLTERVKKKSRKFEFNIVQSTDINAFALPGGFVFLTENILKLCEYNQDEIAFIIAHEMVHIVKGHPLKKIMTSKSLAVLANLVRTASPLGNLTKKTLMNLVESNYSREKEFEADLYGMRLIAASGFDPKASAKLLTRLGTVKNKPVGKFNYFASHPPVAERVQCLSNMIKKL